MVYSEYFNPLSLYRERQGDFYGKLSGVIFQSTLPIQGETIRREKAGKAPEAFQSTLPIQGETEADTANRYYRKNFNPLSLYRERQQFCT